MRPDWIRLGVYTSQGLDYYENNIETLAYQISANTRNQHIEYFMNRRSSVPPEDVGAPDLLVLDHALQGDFHEFVLGCVLIALDKRRYLVGGPRLSQDIEYFFSVLTHKLRSLSRPIALTVSTY